MHPEGWLDSIPAMRAPRTLVSYLVREVMGYTLLGLAAITVVLVTRNLIRALDELVAAGFTLQDLLLVLRLLATMLVIYALPVAFLFGVLLAIGRMAADVEITAMRACGIGLRTLTVPVVMVGLLISGMTLRLSLDAEPAARREMRRALTDMLARGAAIEPGRFRQLGDRLLYVESRDGEQRLHGIVISDRSDPERPFMVFAETGEVKLDPDAGKLRLWLESGDIHVEGARPDEERYQHIAFSRFEYEIDVAAVLGPKRERRAKEMSMEELAFTMRRAARGDTEGLREDEPLAYALHWHRRIAAPFASTLFGLVAVPLAMRRTRGARSLGVMWCAGLAFLYYAIGSMAEFLCVQGWLSPAVAPWTPNVTFAALGGVLLARARRGGA